MVRFFKNDVFTCHGDPIHLIYKPIVDSKGNIDLEVAGKENTDDIIQSYAESCDIQVILNNAANGDLSGLSRAKGVYGDFTSMPKTFAEMLQLQIDSAKLFESLDSSTKIKFDNDPNKFFAQAGEKEWYEKLGYVEKQNENIKESEEIKEG